MLDRLASRLKLHSPVQSEARRRKIAAHAAFRSARSEAFHLNLPADKVLAELTARLKEKRHAETVLELRSVVRGYAKPVLTGVDLTEWR